MTHFFRAVCLLILPVHVHAMEHERDVTPCVQTHNQDKEKKEDKVLEALKYLNLFPYVITQLIAQYINALPQWQDVQRWNLGVRERPGSLAWDATGRQIVCGDKEQGLNITQINRYQQNIDCAQAGSIFNPIHCIAWSPAAPHIFAAGSKDGTVSIWDVTKEPTCLRSLNGIDCVIRHLAWSPDGQCIAAAGNKINIWNATSGTHQKTVLFQEDIKGLIYAENSVFVATSPTTMGKNCDAIFTIWSVEPKKNIRSFNTPKHKRCTNEIRRVVWSPDQQRIASSSTDGRVRVWDVSTGICTHDFEGDPTGSAMAWSPCSAFIAAAQMHTQRKTHTERTCTVWDTYTHNAVIQKKINTEDHYSKYPIACIAYSSCGTKIAACSRNPKTGTDFLLLTASESSKYDITDALK